MSFKALKGHPLRTTLTMLGICIGIFAITGIFTFVNSLQSSISGNLSQLGNTVLYVHHWPWKDNSEDWYKYMNRPKVSYEEFLALKRELRNVEGVAFEAGGKAQTLSAGKRSITGVEAKGITGDYWKINGYAIREGRYFTEREMNAGRAVCILGANVARSLFGPGPYLYREVRLRGKKMTVVGVQESEGSTFFGSSPDDKVYMPFAFASRMFNLNNRNVEKLITVKAENREVLELVESQIIGTMRSVRGLKPRMENSFSINKQEMLMKQLDGFFDYLRIGGIVISIFSVIVGGFGIGNIMYATVKERTFEIGLQKSLGASRNFILFQFLFEAILLCLMGGLLGMAMLWGIAELAEGIISEMDIALNISVSASVISTGLIISVAIGLVSGFMPALFASRLDPVEAMRG